MYTIQSTTNHYGTLLVAYYGTFATIGDADRARTNIVNHAPKTGAHYAAVLITKYTPTPKPIHPSYL